MEGIDRLQELTAQMHLEPAEDTGCPQLDLPKKHGLNISHAVISGGKQITLLKTLLTSACERNCYYCPFRSGRDYRRASFKPEEMAKAFMVLHKAGAVEGMFLSSGMVNGGIHTQDLLIDTAVILRKKLGFRGYIHLKIMPGAERDQVARTMQLADRVSINLEAPNTERLLKLAPRKEFMDELLQPLQWVEEVRRTQPGRLGWNGRWPSVTTQFVVGAVGESDLELLSTTGHLIDQVHLRRAYFSAFSPVRDTPLENQPAENPLREHRLYQSSFLLRDYGFSVEDMPFDPAGNLPLGIDPKLAWAQANLTYQPIEINHAGRGELLKVPGFGPKSVDAILTARRQGQKVRLHNLEDLRKIGVNPSRAAPFILIDGKQPTHQLSLF
jgi:predicted DNA-binding helix-hairpin-helix protein